MSKYQVQAQYLDCCGCISISANSALANLRGRAKIESYKSMSASCPSLDIKASDPDTQDYKSIVLWTSSRVHLTLGHGPCQPYSPTQPPQILPLKL